jgi:uncharacterized lipoprotein YmbA
MNAKVKIEKDDAVVLPGVGHVVGVVEFIPGFSGSYWQPPEGLEIVNCDLQSLDGDISRLFAEDEQAEAAYDALVDAVQTLWDKSTAEYEKHIDEQDSRPF